MVRIAVAALIALCAAAPAAFAQAAPPTDPALQPVLDKMAQYIATYGEKASMFVGVEKYTQSISFPEMTAPARPRKLVAEFAIIRAAGDAGWVGFRDVVEVDGEKVSDRRDRLMSILTDMSVDSSQATQLANESARYNIGPISRNFNTPTSTLFFFSPANLGRFLFTKKEIKKVNGVETWQLDFKETKTPTIVNTRSGKSVPLEGSLWVVPADGTVVKSRLVMRNFADQFTNPTQANPAPRPAVNPNTPTSAAQSARAIDMGQTLDVQRIDTMADIEVAYARNDKYGVWLPEKMTEMYAGPIYSRRGQPPSPGTATTRATYSDFKQFDTGVKINIPK
jgi:hypothetical protein